MIPRLQRLLILKSNPGSLPEAVTYVPGLYKISRLQREQTTRYKPARVVLLKLLTNADD
jgi:hypothetical protein